MVTDLEESDMCTCKELKCVCFECPKLPTCKQGRCQGRIARHKRAPQIPDFWTVEVETC